MLSVQVGSPGVRTWPAPPGGSPPRPCCKVGGVQAA